MADIETRLRAALERQAGLADVRFRESPIPPRVGPRPLLRIMVAGVTVAIFAAGVIAAGLWIAGRDPVSTPLLPGPQGPKATGDPSPTPGSMATDQGWVTENEMRMWQ